MCVWHEKKGSCGVVERERFFRVIRTKSVLDVDDTRHAIDFGDSRLLTAWKVTTKKKIEEWN